MYDKIDFRTCPVPWDNNYAAWAGIELSVFQCPSDGGIAPQPGPWWRTGRVNYHGCAGQKIVNNEGDQLADADGIFVGKSRLRIADIFDGTSNTLMVGERAMGNLSDPVDPIGHVVRNVAGGDDASFTTACLANSVGSLGKKYNPTGVDFTELGSDDRLPGARWNDGRNYFTACTTTFPPNSISCHNNEYDSGYGIFTLGSRHPGGAQVASADASVHFVPNSIDQVTLRAIGTRGKSDQGQMP